jgi:large subunit ribosomal protein L1
MYKTIEEAVSEMLSKSPERRFKERIDLAINLHNLDMSLPGNRIDAEIVLPHGSGRPAKIAVFAGGETAMQAKRAGADLVMPPTEIEALGEERKRARKLANEFDFFIAESQLMPTIGKNLGPILGKRGKMPLPLPPTADVAPLINRMRSIVRIRSRDRLTFHMPIGNRDMEIQQIAENIEVVITKLEQTLVNGKQNLKSVYVKTTMGPPIKVM